MKFLLFVALIGVKEISCNFLTFSFTQNRDVEDDLENLDYPQSKQNGAEDREPAAWELWDHQNDDSEFKNTENSDSFEDDKATDGFDKPIQNVKNILKTNDKNHHALQVESILIENNNNKKDEISRVSSSAKKNSHAPVVHTCKPHNVQHPCQAQHRVTNQVRPVVSTTRHAPRFVNTTNIAMVTDSLPSHQTIKLDSGDIFSVCDIDGNWSWPLATDQSKRWVKWLWILPFLLLTILLILLFIRTCQNYAAAQCNDDKYRSKACQQVCKEPPNNRDRMCASSPLIRKYEPRKYQTPGPGQQQMRGMKPQIPLSRQMSGSLNPQLTSQLGQLGQIGQLCSQMAPQLSQMSHPMNAQINGQIQNQFAQMKSDVQRKQLFNQPCAPDVKNLNPRIMAVPRIDKTQKLVFLRSPPPYALPRKPSCPCPTRQPYFSAPPKQNLQTHLQQQCVPQPPPQCIPQTQHMMPNYTETRPMNQSPYMQIGYPLACTGSPRKLRAQSPSGFLPPLSPTRKDCSSPRSQSPKPNQNS